jgi:thiol-disulfide isomerase/thioredoxin
VSSKFLKLAKMIGVAVLLTLIGCGSGAQRQTSKETAGVAAAAAPETTVQIPSLEGGPVTIDQYRGKVVLVNFWATWCAPCRTKIPWLNDSLTVQPMSSRDDTSRVSRMSFY